jgi:branched-chain amino acid aminotransferase
MAAVLPLMSYDDRDGSIWFDGHMTPWRDAKIHVLTHGLHYASSIFEGIRVYDKHPFKLTEHTQRLERSAELLGFKLPFSVAVLDQACRDVITANSFTDCYLRPVAWRGSEIMGVSAQKSRIHVAIAVWEWPSYFSAEAKAQGLRLATSQWRRPSPQTAPVHSKAAGLYMICTLAKHAAEDAGFQDALMLDWRGQIAEATGANIFIVFEGKLHTPLPDCFLNGITRQTVMRLASARGIEVIERAIFPDELAKASEVFLTGTAAEIIAVGQIDHYYFAPGPITKVLQEDYQALTRQSTIHP